MNRVTDFFKIQDGVVAVLFVLLLPIIIGGIALGVETGLWLMYRNKLQDIADTAVYSAATRYSAGATEIEALASANAIAASGGFDTTRGILTLTLAAADMMTVTVTRQQPRFFTALFLDQDFVISVNANAQFTMGGVIPPQTCLQSLSATATSAFKLLAQSILTIPNYCEVIVNSSDSSAYRMLGGTVLTAGCLRVAGGAGLNGTQNFSACLAADVGTNISYPDPFAALAEPAASGTCLAAAVGSNTTATVLTPTELHPSGERVMRFCNGLVLTGPVQFNPGLYIIEGGLMRASTSGASITTPNGATFYFRGTGAPSFATGVSATLSPSRSGPWKDILMYGSRTANSTTYNFGDDELSGIIYAISAQAVFATNSTQGGCFQLITDQVTLGRSARVLMNCDTSAFRPGGGTNSGGAGTVKLVP